ncbi:unnamed protein product, partial [Ectocarpus sp. 8 AP-2014]
QATQWEKPKQPTPSTLGRSNGNSEAVEPSAAPTERYVAKVDGPARRASSSRREPESGLDTKQRQQQQSQQARRSSSSHDALNRTSVEPSAAPAGRPAATVDRRGRKSSSTSRAQREDVPDGRRPSTRSSNSSTASCSSGDRDRDADASRSSDVYEYRGSGGRGSRQTEDGGNDDTVDSGRGVGGGRKELPSSSRRQGSTSSSGSSRTTTKSDSVTKSTRGHRKDKSEGAGGLASALPDGWRRAYTKTGRLFYRNERENLTTWDPPTSAEGSNHGSAGSSSSRGSADGVGRGRDMDRDGRDRSKTRPYTCTTNVDDGAQTSHLPHGGSKAYTKTGEGYHRNKHDKITAGDRPVLVEEPNGADAGGMDKNRGRGGEKKSVAQTSGSAEKKQPLAPGWSKAYTKTGEVYYRNKHDKTTTWDRPVLVEEPNGADAGGKDNSGGRGGEKKPPAQTSGSVEKEQPLAAGWSKAYTKTGEVYYRNKHDKTTTWDRPVLAEEPNGAGAGSMDKKSPAQAETQQPLAPGKLHTCHTNDVFRVERGLRARRQDLLRQPRRQDHLLGPPGARPG